MKNWKVKFVNAELANTERVETKPFIKLMTTKYMYYTATINLAYNNVTHYNCRLLKKYFIVFQHIKAVKYQTF